MADRTIEQVPADVPAFEGILEAVLLQTLEIGRESLESGEELVPFTALAVGDTLFTETHPADDSEACFAAAQHTVQNARGASAYAFCYDGYVDTDEGELDAIIAEGGVPGSSEGHAIGYLYTTEGEGEDFRVKIDGTPLYIGQAPNFMEFTLVVMDDDEDDSDYRADDVDEADDGPEEDDWADGPDDAAIGSRLINPYSN